MMRCLKRIEQEREELHYLVEQYGFSDHRVLVKSQQLDQTLNEFNRNACIYDSSKLKI